MQALAIDVILRDADPTSALLGTVQMLAAGVALALTSALNIQGARSARWGAVSRFLP